MSSEPRSHAYHALRRIARRFVFRGNTPPPPSAPNPNRERPNTVYAIVVPDLVDVVDGAMPPPLYRVDDDDVDIDCDDDDNGTVGETVVLCRRR